MADFKCRNIDNKVIGHIFWFALDGQCVEDNQQFSAFFNTGTLARNGDWHFEFNNLIGREELKVGMNDSIGYRVKLNLFDKRAFDFAVRELKIDNM